MRKTIDYGDMKYVQTTYAHKNYWYIISIYYFVQFFNKKKQKCLTRSNPLISIVEKPGDFLHMMKTLREETGSVEILSKFIQSF